MSLAQTTQLPLFCGSPLSDVSVSGRRASSRAPTVAGPALRLCVLGSGSGGNSTVLRFGDEALLIDAGFGPRTTRRRLAQARLDLEQVGAICLTHLDQDHFRRSWPATLLKLGIRLFVHHWHLDDLARLRGTDTLFDAGLIETFDADAFEPLQGVSARGVRLQHDLQGTIGYRFDVTSGGDSGGASEGGVAGARHRGSIGYATDLGHAPSALVEHFAGVDLLCLECNYDEHMTITSPRPSFVNRRNMSDSGHLSNEQSYDTIQRIAALSPRGNPRHVLLMHRSQQCNHATKVKRVFARDPILSRRVVLTEQRRRTRWFDVRPLRAMQREQQLLRF